MIGKVGLQLFKKPTYGLWHQVLKTWQDNHFDTFNILQVLRFTNVVAISTSDSFYNKPMEQIIKLKFRMMKDNNYRLFMF